MAKRNGAREEFEGNLGSPGQATDAQGQAVIDPSRNVLDLVDAAIKRQDDLREQESRHIREILKLRGDHALEIRESETARINAIREVDVQAVQRAAEVQATQATALASQVVATADAFRVSLAAALEPLQTDIAELRKSQYELAGQRAQVVETRDVHGSGRTDTMAILMGIGVLVAIVVGVLGLIVG